jgi:hypothetical protein
MTTREEISEQYGDELLFLDPPEQFDSCIAGVATRCGMGNVVVYDADKVIKALTTGDMSEEDAQEWFEFNILGAYIGENTPMFLSTLDDAKC